MGPLTESTDQELPMAMLSNLDLIRRVRLFSMLTPEQAQTVANSVTKRRFKRGEAGIPQFALLTPHHICDPGDKHGLEEACSWQLEDEWQSGRAG